jgi:hypothetical protein
MVKRTGRRIAVPSVSGSDPSTAPGLSGRTEPVARAGRSAAVRSAWLAFWMTVLTSAAPCRVPEDEAKQPSRQDTVPGPVAWLEKINLTGVLNAEGRWQQHVGAPASRSGAGSALYLRQFSLGIGARLLQGASAMVVLNSEWIGDDQMGGDGNIALDEIHFDMEGVAHVLVGRQTQPFGQFESDLVTDPMTQSAYETKQVGVTLGVNGPWAGEASFTIYKGTPQMDQLLQSGLFDTAGIRRRPMTPRHVDSFIASSQASPWTDHLTVFGAWLSEPGHGSRNTSVDAGFTFVPPLVSGLTVNVEAVRALSREVYAGLHRPCREGVLSASVSYAFVVKKRQVSGRRNYQARRSSQSSHPIVATARVESFDDDGLAAAAGSWSVKSRSGIGIRYAFRNDGRVLAFVQTEVRRTCRRGVETGHDRGLEAYVRVGMDF